MYFCLFYMSVFLGVVTLDIIPGLGSNFGLVDIPSHIRYQLVLFCLLAFSFNFVLEHTMRNLFPAPKPPSRGYMEPVFAKKLKEIEKKKKEA